MRNKPLLAMFAGIVILCLAGLSPANFESSDTTLIPEKGDCIARSVIGCMIAEAEVEKIVENASDRRAYDIIMLSSFHDHRHKECSAFLLDRRLAGKPVWIEYLNFIATSGVETPIVLVDDIQQWIKPGNDTVSWLDPGEEGLTGAMVMKLDFLRIRDEISSAISRLISH